MKHTRVITACAVLAILVTPQALAKSKKASKKLQPMQGILAPEPATAPLKGGVDQTRINEDASTQVGIPTQTGTPVQDSLFSPSTPQLKGGTQEFLLQGGVKRQVPRTPEAVADYFRKMRAIITAYDGVCEQILLGQGGLNTDPTSIEAARQQTLGMVAQVRAIVPPDEISKSHGLLATTMGNLGEFLAAGTQDISALGRALSLVTEVHDTLESYHSGALQCIAYYKLDPKLDPFSNEDPNTAARFADGLNKYKDQKIGELTGGLGAMAGGRQSSGGSQDGSFGDLKFGSGGGGGAASMFGQAGSLFGGSQGGSGSGAGGGLGALGGMLGGSGAAGGLGALGGLLGGQGGLSGGQSPAGGLGALGGLLGGSAAGGSGGGQAPDLGSLGGALGGALGGSGGQSMDMGSLMKQLQGLMGGGSGAAGGAGAGSENDQIQQLLQDGN